VAALWGVEPPAGEGAHDANFPAGEVQVIPMERERLAHAKPGTGERQ
jgi:hypothetical protein